MNTLTGKVLKVTDNKIFSKKKNENYEYKTLVIDTGAKWKSTVPIEAHGDKMPLLNGVKEGDTVEVQFFVNGSEWNGKYYPSLTIGEIQVKGGEGTPVQQTPPPTEEEVDLPF